LKDINITNPSKTSEGKVHPQLLTEKVKFFSLT